MTDYIDLQKAAAYAAQDTIKFADEDEEMRALQQFHEEVSPETVLALIAENERLTADCSSMRGSLKAYAVTTKKLVKDGSRAARESDKLRAEVAGLKTGYEAYERVNAELKAENEALRAKWENPDPILIKCMDSAIAEHEQLERDAERYRWLRRASHFDTPQHQAFCKAYGAALDEEIDAALGKGEQS